MDIHTLYFKMQSLAVKGVVNLIDAIPLVAATLHETEATTAYEEHQQLLAEVRAEVKPLEEYLEQIFYASGLTLIEPDIANDENYALDA